MKNSETPYFLPEDQEIGSLKDEECEGVSIFQSLYPSVISHTYAPKVEPSPQSVAEAASNSEKTHPSSQNWQKGPYALKSVKRIPIIFFLSFLSHRIDIRVGPIFQVTNVAAV